MHVRQLLLTILLASNPAISQDSSQAEKVAVNVLRDRFETVAYTRTELLTAFDKRERRVDNWRSLYDYPLALRLPFVPLAGALRSLDLNSLLSLSTDYTAFVSGARNFKPPDEEVGFATFESCNVGVSPNRPSVVNSIFGSVPTVTSSGWKFWEWTANRPPQISFYATYVDPHYLIICDRIEDAVILRQELSSPAETKAGNSPNRYYSYWISRKNTNAEILRTSVQNMTLLGDVEGHRGRFRVELADSKRSADLTGLLLGSRLDYRRVGVGIWESELALEQSPASVNVTYELLALFGYTLNL